MRETRTFNLADLFEVAAAAVPDREAAVCGSRRLTYADLDDRANRLASVLADAGVGVGDHVGLHLYNGTEYLEGMLAAFKLRAVPINVNYRYVAEELRYLFNDADLTAVIHETDFTGVVNDIKPDVPTLRFTLERGGSYEDALASGDPMPPRAARSGDDIYILYTGGTTGLPKGVMWRHEDIFFSAFGGGNSGGSGPIEYPDDLATRAERGRTRMLPACPFMHGTAHWMAMATFFTGGTVVIDSGVGFDACRLLELAAAERITFLVIVGDAFGRPLVDALDARGPAHGPQAPWDLTSLTVILSGGAILSPAVKDALVARLPGSLVVDGYGASETGGQGQMVAVPGASGPQPRFVMGPDTVVLDEQLRPLPAGSERVGRLARRGRVPLGYYKDAAKTEATFPVVDGVRWAVPGDFATVDDEGVITLLGRGSVSINTGGEKVYPEEVEAVLKGHPAVFDAVVVGVADERWGQRVTAVVQVRDGHDAPTLEELSATARDSLAGYKVPRGVVVVDAIIRSPSGKPDYRWAQAMAEAAS
jgi:acyl-CoA synthetase (AMP-forming)/AMP-acid ligase II